MSPTLGWLDDSSVAVFVCGCVSFSLSLAARCEEAGIRYHVVALEATGGVEDREALPLLHRIAAAVAAAEDKEVAAAKAELLERLSLELVRSAAQAVLRRAPKTKPGGERAAVAFLRREARLAAPEGAVA